ncbi:MAG: glycosyltransferase family 39 protein [Devosia sp.]|nr:glycosyltransferase family 39 protein [Devosia sp.]
MASPDPLRNSSGWLSLPNVAGVVLLLAAARLFIAARSGLVFDEGYYTFWSERLATGYLDHPPAVAWLIAAGRALLGDHELGVRVMAVACGVGASAAIWRIGVLLLDRSAAALAVLLYNLTPAAGLGFLMTPDPPSALFWAATLWAIAEAVASGRAGWWLAAGALGGLGLWSKYTDAFLAPGVLLYLLSSAGPRRWLRRWQVWAAPVVALAVFSPVVWWNAQRDWASFRFQGQRTVTTGIDPNWAGNFFDLLAGQSLYAAPILVLLALAGLTWFFFRPGAPERGELALAVWTTLPALAYFLFHALHGHVEANWLIPLWPGLALVAAVSLLGLGRASKWLGAAVFGVQAVIGIGLTLLVYVQLLWQPIDLGGIDRTRETRGWAKLQRDIEATAEANGAHWIATAGNFGITGELASYFLFAHSPLPVRQIDEPDRWQFLGPIDPDTLGWPALYVALSANPPTDLFGKWQLVGTATRDGGLHPIERFSLMLVSQPTAKFMAGIGK